MTEYELKNEIARLKEKARKAEQHGMINEYAVLERKIAMAKAYMLNPDDFPPGETYEIDGAPGEYFKVEYLKGLRLGVSVIISFKGGSTADIDVD